MITEIRTGGKTAKIGIFVCFVSNWGAFMVIDAVGDAGCNIVDQVATSVSNNTTEYKLLG